MLDSLRLKNFTAFSEAEFQFAPGLNVLVGENATGKTHVLKVAYVVNHVLHEETFKSQSRKSPTFYLKSAVAEKLVAVFKPDELGRLVRHGLRKRQRAVVACRYSNASTLNFSFSAESENSVSVQRTSGPGVDERPVYFPTRELMTIYPEFISLYETTHLPFDETWRDTCLLLGAGLAKGSREKRAKELLAPIEEAMGGEIELTKTGGFYLNVAGVRTEMHLVAEGFRKLAMIARLIATGALAGKGCLFWDEPEANLNPNMVKLVARTILHLCQSGIQVFIASHSLFLLRELDILLQTDEFQDVSRRFFGLHRDEARVSVQQGDSVDDIGTIAALEEELSQSDRYLASEAT